MALFAGKVIYLENALGVTRREFPIHHESFAG
jgi:hypothetical protein